MLPLWLMAICIASCSSSDDDNNVEPTPADTSVQARIDSIALPSDDPALFKFDYDKNKVKNYAINVRWLWTKTFGRDSVTFDYLQDRIVANMSFLKETGSWGMHAKVKRTATFYLQGGMIVAASLPLQMHETLKDSIQYYYEGGKLSKYTVYEVTPAAAPFFKYEQRLLWNDVELTGMTATKDGETIYETTFTYNDHAFSALLPYMTFDYQLDNDKTYISVLANMGYFGMLPRHDLSAITIFDKRVHYRHQCQISYNYAANGLPDSFDYKYVKAFSGYEPETWQVVVEDGWQTTESQNITGVRVAWSEAN